MLSRKDIKTFYLTKTPRVPDVHPNIWHSHNRANKKNKKNKKIKKGGD